MTAFSNSADFSFPHTVKSPAAAYDCIMGNISLQPVTQITQINQEKSIMVNLPKQNHAQDFLTFSRYYYHTTYVPDFYSASAQRKSLTYLPYLKILLIPHTEPSKKFKHVHLWCRHFFKHRSNFHKMLFQMPLNAYLQLHSIIKLHNWPKCHKYSATALTTSVPDTSSKQHATVQLMWSQRRSSLASYTYLLNHLLPPSTQTLCQSSQDSTGWDPLHLLNPLTA